MIDFYINFQNFSNYIYIYIDRYLVLYGLYWYCMSKTYEIFAHTEMVLFSLNACSTAFLPSENAVWRLVSDESR